MYLLTPVMKNIDQKEIKILILFSPVEGSSEVKLEDVTDPKSLSLPPILRYTMVRPFLPTNEMWIDTRDESWGGSWSRRIFKIGTVMFLRTYPYGVGMDPFLGVRRRRV